MVRRRWQGNVCCHRQRTHSSPRHRLQRLPHLVRTLSDKQEPLERQKVGEGLSGGHPIHNDRDTIMPAAGKWAETSCGGARDDLEYLARDDRAHQAGVLPS